MIPIGLPSVEWLLCVLALLTATLVWGGWTLGLALRPSWRERLRGPRRLVYLALGGAALFTIYQIAALQWLLQAHRSNYQARYRPVLSAPQRLGGIDMPAGTQLELQIADWRESFNVAVFPAPQPVAGVQTTRVERYVKVEDDSAYQPVRAEGSSMRLLGHGVSVQQGWRCDATHPVEFALQANGEQAVFERCVLAPGNALQTIALPAGAQLRASTGNVYVDGFVDSDRWVIAIDDQAEIAIDGLVLTGPVLSLDGQRQIHEIDNAVLAQGAQFGPRQHPPGSSAQLNPRQLRDSHPGAWLISAPEPESGSAAAAVVQSRSGQVLALLPAS